MKAINKYFLWTTITLILTVTLAHFGTAYGSNAASKIDQTLSNKNNVPSVKQIAVSIPRNFDISGKPEKGNKEITKERNSHSKLFIAPNGDLTQEIYPKSVFYLNNQSEWVPIDPQLIPTKQTPITVKDKANRFDTLFADEAKFRYQEKDKFIDLWPMNPYPSLGSVTDNKITYHDVYPKTDIQFTSDNDEVKEAIILQTPNAPHTFIFGVDTQGLQLIKDETSGFFSLLDSKGNVIAYATPFMTDAKNERISPINLVIQNTNGKTQLVASVDPAWIKKENLEYPVQINLTLVKNDNHTDPLNSDEHPFVSSNLASYSFNQYVSPNFHNSLSNIDLSANLFQYTESLLQQEASLNHGTVDDETSDLMDAWDLANTLNNGTPNFVNKGDRLDPLLPVDASNEPIITIHRKGAQSPSPIDKNGSYSRATTNTVINSNFSLNDESLNDVGTSLQVAGNGSIVLTNADGTRSTFNKNTDGTFSPTMGVFSQFMKNAQSNTYTALRIDGLKLFFNSIGNITAVKSSNGIISDFIYDHYGRLSQISGTSGKSYFFTYDTNGNLVRITDPEGKNIVYGYDANENLIFITDSSKNISMAMHYPVDMVSPIKAENMDAAITEHDSTEKPNQENTVFSILQGKNNWDWVTPSMRVTTPFGPREKEFHKGLDIGAIQPEVDGDPVWAMADGTIEYAGVATGYGNVIYLRHPNGIQTRYGHLSSIHVKTGEFVKQGELIGTMGHSGAADGTHLHFEIRQNDQPLNPELFFQLPGRPTMVKNSANLVSEAQ